MSVQTDIAEIESALHSAETANREAHRKLRHLHNLLASKLAEHAGLLGLSESDVIAMGGGTPKDDEPVGG